MKRVAVLALLLTGCSGAQLKSTNSIYEGLHALRMSVESIPGVVPLADLGLPWIAGVRLGLDKAYKVKHTLLPDNFSLQSASSVSPTAQALSSTSSEP